MTHKILSFFTSIRYIINRRNRKGKTNGSQLNRIGMDQ